MTSVKKTDIRESIVMDAQMNDAFDLDSNDKVDIRDVFLASDGEPEITYNMIRQNDKGYGRGFWAIIQNDGQQLGRGPMMVYDMGRYWDGGGHPGGSIRNYLTSNNYNLTQPFKQRHQNRMLQRLLRRAVYKGILKQ